MDYYSKFLLSLEVFLVVACWSSMQALSKPVHSQEARLRRNVETPSSKFIRELYNHSTAPPPQANIIRSLPYEEKVIPTCGQFNFSLLAINSTREYLLQSEIHLYLNRPPYSNYVANIKATLSSGEHVHVMRTLNIREGDLGSGYYIFPVDTLVKRLLLEGEGYAAFTITLYKDIQSYQTQPPQPPLPCTEMKFVYEEPTADNIPLFIVYSYDQSIEKIDYTALTALTSEMPTSTEPIVSEPIMSEVGRKKRSSTACGVNEFQVKSDLLLPVLGDYSANLLFPLTYHAGICGGTCIDTPPVEASNHAQYTHALLATRRDLYTTTYPNYKYERCCIPVKFRHLQIISESEERGAQMVWLRNMIVEECACVDYIKNINI